MKIKKITSIILILMILIAPFCSLLNVGAEGTITKITTDENNKAIDTANIIINDVYTDTDTFNAYKLLDVYYDNTSNEVSYKFTDLFTNFQKSTYGTDFTSMSIDEYVALGENTESDIQKFELLVTSFAKYIRSLESAGNSVAAVALDTADGTAKKAVEVGSYLVLSSNVTDVYIKVIDSVGIVNDYTAVIANVVYEAVDNQWTLSDYTCISKHNIENFFYSILLPFDSSKFNDAAEGVTAFKNMPFYKNKTFIYGAMPNAVSTVDNPTRLVVSFPAGIDVEKIYFDDLYDNDGNSELIDIVDGKAINRNGVQVATVVSNVSNGATTVTIDFLDFDPNRDYMDDFIFDIKLNDNAVIGNPGNVIKATLYYVKDRYAPKPSTWEEYPQFTSENIVTTYDLQITNKDATDNSLLSGGVFDVYSDSGYTNKIGTITISSDGTGVLSGVVPGEYYLKQVKAPTGYRVAQSLDKVTVGDDIATTNVDILSTKAGLLPSTGGLGTILYTSFGLLIVVLGSIAFVSYRKRQLQN